MATKSQDTYFSAEKQKNITEINISHNLLALSFVNGTLTFVSSG